MPHTEAQTHTPSHSRATRHRPDVDVLFGVGVAYGEGVVEEGVGVVGAAVGPGEGVNVAFDVEFEAVSLVDLLVLGL